MVNPIFTEPVEGDDPCGPDMQWDTEFVQIGQDFEMAKVQAEDAAVDGELADSGDQPTFEKIIEQIEALLTKTKDLRLMTMYVEASWHEGGLGGFANALEGMAVAIETWSEPDTGIHPRADEDDGDLGTRVAPVGKLVNQVSFLANTLGWGSQQLEISERKEVGALLKGVFDSWTKRLEGALGDGLPSAIQSWKDVQRIIGDEKAVEVDEDGVPAAGGGGGGGGVALAGGDAWDAVERAAELMLRQDHHSPALPVLRMLSGWRSLGIIEIANDMRTSGVSLEQLLESIKKQTTGVGGGAAAIAPVAPAAPAAAPPSHPGLS